MLLFISLTVVLLAFPKIQTTVGSYASSQLEKKYGVKIQIKKIDISLDGKVHLKEVIVKDHLFNKLIYLDDIATSIINLPTMFMGELKFGEIAINHFILNIKTYKGEQQNSLSYFVDKFKPKNQKIKESKFLMSIPSISFEDGNVFIENENLRDHTPLFYKNICGNIKKILIDDSDIIASAKNISFNENNGLNVVRLDSKFSYNRSEMSFNKTTLVTDNSKILGDFSLLYKKSSFSDFLNKVQMNAQIKNSKVSSNDIRKFYKNLKPNQTAFLNAEFKGIINNFKIKNLDFKTGNETIIKGDLSIKNISRPKQKIALQGSFSKIISDYDQLKSLLPLAIEHKIPPIIQKFGKFSVSGDASFSKNVIDTDLVMNTEIGTADFNLKLTNSNSIDSIAYKGSINVVDFEIGKILNSQKIKKVSLQADVDGSGFTLKALNTQVKGNISKFHYKRYEYNNISINGLLKNQLFNGYLEVNDDHIKLNFKGLADFSSERYTYDFKTTVDYCDLKAIKIFERDQISKFKGGLEIKLTGTNIDNITGKVKFQDFFYSNEKQDYFFKDFSLTSLLYDNGFRNITVDSSEIIKGNVHGKFKMNDVVKIAQNALGSLYSNYEPIEVSPGQKIGFNLKIQDKIIDILFPKIELSPKTSIYGSLNSDKQSIRLWVRSPKITAYGNKIEDIDLQLDNKNPIFNTQLKIGSITSKELNIAEFKLANVTINDTLRFRSTFKSGKKQMNRFDLSFFYTINDEKKSVAGLEKSKFNYRGNTWYTNPGEDKLNKVEYDHEKKEFEIKPIVISSGKQKLEFFGNFDLNKSKNLTFNFTDLDLEKITIESENKNFTGKLNGKFSYIEDRNNLKPTANLTLSNFHINNSLQGDLTLKLTGDNSLKKYDINAVLIRDQTKSLAALGEIDFTPKKPRLNVRLDFDKFKLDVLSPLGGNVFSNTRGYIFGDVTFTGLLENPTMNGSLELSNAGMYFPYINVDYQMNGRNKVMLSGQNFNFNDLKIEDTKKNTTGKLNGSLSYKKLKNWFLDISINSKNLLVLNTQPTEDAAFYGTAFLNGKAAIYGPFNKLNIDVQGSTNKNTYFAVPISDVKIAEEGQLIRFLSENESENKKQRKAFISKKLNSLNLNFNLDINNNAVFEMVLDQATGSNLKGSGTGNIQISVDTKDKFEMYGDILLDNGVYNFKYGGFINKPFDARKGGGISWSGDPYTAIIDIDAVYRVSANPRTLLENLNTNRRIPINLITRFSGELFNSERKFDIEILNISNSLASELAIRLNENDENTKTRHFVSLLASGSFYNENNLGINTTGIVYGTASDILSNAFDKIFNQGNNKLKFKPIYTVGERNGFDDAEVDDQLSLDLDYQMNDRILINGKVGVPIGGNEQSSVISEVNIDFLLNKEGNLRSSAFNRQNEIQYNNEEEGYTQGVGLSYQIDFNSGKELLNRIKRKKRKRNTNRKKIDTTATKNNNTIPIK